MRHLGQGHTKEFSSGMTAAREAAREAARVVDWWAQDWMQRRWKRAKQREEQDQVGSVGLMRSRQMRQESAPEREEVRKDWIFVRS